MLRRRADFFKSADARAFKVMGDDYLKQAEELQKNGVVVHVAFPKTELTH